MIYAVGDIHGCLDMLKEMLREIEKDASTRDGDHSLVFLGDYIDRGPDSKGVVALLKEGSLPMPAVFLMGNHEDMLLGGNVPHWLSQGGDKTVESYGGAPSVDHIKWMRTLQISHRVGKWLFVHAGVDPTKSLAEQDREAMLWIRSKFLMHNEPFEDGTVIVHGHSPNDEPEVEENRINLDTGACYGRALSCAVLSENSLERIIQVHANKSR